MIEHSFTGKGPYCEEMIKKGPRGSKEHGFITMEVQCGYPAKMHIEEVTKDENYS